MFIRKNDIFSIKFILNTLSCHMSIININLTTNLLYFFHFEDTSLYKENYLDYVITILGNPCAIQA